MNTERLHLPKAKGSLRASLSPDRLRLHGNTPQLIHPLRPSIESRRHGNNYKTSFIKKALSVKSIHLTPIQLRGSINSTSNEQERSFNFVPVPNTDRYSQEDSEKAPLRSISLGIDSQFAITSRVTTRYITSNRGSSKSPQPRERYSILNDKINLSQSSLDLKPYERSQERSKVMSKETFLLNYKLAKKHIADEDNAQKIAETGKNIVTKIISLARKPPQFDIDSLSKKEQFEKELSMKIRLDNASRNKKQWVSPMEIFRSDSPSRMKVPKRLPKLVLTGIKPQISARESMFDDSNLETEQESVALTQRLRTARSRVPILGMQFACDQRSVNKYIEGFSKLVSVSENLAQAINNLGVSMEELEYQQLQDLVRSTKEETEANFIPHDFSNTRGNLIAWHGMSLIIVFK